MSVQNFFIEEFVIIAITLSVIVLTYFKWTYQYWKRRGLQYIEPTIPFGNIKSNSSTQHLGVELKKIYDDLKLKGWKHAGIYGVLEPLYLVTDLDYVKNILTKDFQYFVSRGIYHDEKVDPLSGHLFNISGSRWRNLRTKMTPTFTSGKMKQMFQTLVDCEEGLQGKMKIESGKQHPVDIKDILGCFTTDVIGSCAFGLDCQTFEEENSPFRIYGNKVFIRSPMRQFKRRFAAMFPNLTKKLHISIFPKDVSDFFLQLVKDTVGYREKNNIKRNDFMQLLIEMRNDQSELSNDGRSLTIEEIAAQSFVFFIAGFETSSTTMTFALYELSRNQNIQEKARKEICEVLARYDGKITYDAIQEMKYLNQVIDEALRLYPPGPLTSRKCAKDYQVPDTDIIIEKGTMVLIPIYAIHRDPEYYPDPEKFDPERFSDENKNSRHSYTHIPFGEGPRICIGMRFGLMQTKVGLASLLRNFKFTVNEKTLEPLKMKPNTLVLSAVGEIWLNAERISA